MAFTIALCKLQVIATSRINNKLLTRFKNRISKIAVCVMPGGHGLLVLPTVLQRILSYSNGCLKPCSHIFIGRIIEEI